MTVWRITGKIIRAVLCYIVYRYYNCAQWYTYTVCHNYRNF